MKEGFVTVMALRNLKLESAPRFLCILHACSDTLSHFVTVTLWLQFLLLSQDASYFSRLRSQELARPTCSDWARIRVVYERSRMDEGTIFRTRESRHDLGHHLASPFVRPDLLRHTWKSPPCASKNLETPPLRWTAGLLLLWLRPVRGLCEGVVIQAELLVPLRGASSVT